MTKIYFDDAFLDSYTLDPAAASGRLEPALKMLREHYTITGPAPVRILDLRLL